MDLHNGYIWVHSEGIGHGSVFSIELPITLTQPLDSNRDMNAQIKYKTIYGNDKDIELNDEQCDDSDGDNNNNDNNKYNNNDNNNNNNNDNVDDSNTSDLLVESDSSKLDAQLVANAKIKALIVDDSSMNRKMVRRLLLLRGKLNV
jgi:hypothetical protein